MKVSAVAHRPVGRVPSRRALIAGGVAALLAVGLGACASPEDAAPQESAAENPTTRAVDDESGTWTVLAYSIADTDLEPYLLDDMDEMGLVGSSEGLNLVALVDRAEGHHEGPVLGLDDWSGAKMLEVGQGGAQVLQDMGDVNTGDPQLLADFIASGIQQYPADKYALIISDHGASWPGVGGDESSDHDTLTLAETHDGIAAGLAQAGVERLDLVGFDACLMATYEVAGAMAPVADRMLASQELEPGHGWDYTALEAGIGGSTTVELGSALIDGFEAQAVAQGTESEITLSLVDLTAMDAVDQAVEEFSTVLLEQAAGLSPVVGRSLASTLGFGRSTDPEQDSHMTDLGILAGQIGVDSLPAADAADAVVRAVNDVVLDKVDGQATRGATGLSIYFPPRVDYFDGGYPGTFGVSPTWAQFLQTYYSTGSEIPAQAQASFSSDAEVWIDEDGLNIAAEFDQEGADNLVSAYVQYGVVEADGTSTYLGEEPAELLDDGTAWGYFDLTYLVMSDGVDTTTAYLAMTMDEDAGVMTIDVPLSYYPPGSQDPQDVLLSLVLDIETGDLISETYYLYTGSMYGALTADPEGIIVPELPVTLPDGSETWVGSSDVGLWADLPGLTYDLLDFEPGSEIFIELWVVDFGGNESMVSGQVIL